MQSGQLGYQKGLKSTSNVLFSLVYLRGCIAKEVKTKVGNELNVALLGAWGRQMLDGL